MTKPTMDAPAPVSVVDDSRRTFEIVSAGLQKRYAAERRFRRLGALAVFLGLFFVAVLFVDIFLKGYGAFQQTYVRLQVEYTESLIDPDATRDPEQLAFADYSGLVKKSLRDAFPDVSDRKSKRQLYKLVSSGASQALRDRILENPALIGTSETVWVLADDDIDMLVKGHIDRNLPENERRVKDQSLAWVEQLEQQGAIEKRFNREFFTAGDSRQPEQAGIAGALKGSFYTLLLTLLFSFPIGVGTAIYLEEFAPRNKWTDLIEVNINNLAAVPSIIFGLLGLAVFIGLFGVPRSTPLVGSLVLTLMTLPTIIIASRSALKSVPPSIREAALGVGASPLQTQFHHVLPLAMPGMLTGTIIGMAQALGETAPLLMIGMIAFIVDVPQSITDPATVMPVQIFLWADSPERAFVERTSAAILVLLAFLISMNLSAVLLRKRFERRW